MKDELQTGLLERLNVKIYKVYRKTKYIFQ